MTAISLRHVHKRYGKNPFTIRDVNLEISSGEFCVFVGPSGCGKSTLLRLIAGLEDITSGEIVIGDRVVNQVAPAKRGVAMVFQSYALYPHMTVYENMAFGLRTTGQDSGDTDRKVQQAARILGLEPLLQRLPKELSGGQRQRVAIGRAIVRDPQVFLFDEPLSNLDAALRVQTRLEIAKLHRETGTTSLFYVTHDQVEAMTLASRIVLLNTGADVQKYGSVAQFGPPLELYHRPKSKFVAGFIGSPKMNFISGSLVGPSKEDSTGVKVGNIVLPVRATSPNAQPGAAVTLGVRPEHISLAAPDQAGTLPAQVSYLEQLGETSYAYVDTPADGLVTVRLENKNLPKIGDNVGLYVAPDKTHIFDSEGQAFQRTVTFAS